MKRVILAALLIALALPTTAIDKQYVYTQISQKEGLTSTVNCIFKEKDGAVWIGTPNGLYSFNGYSLSSYAAMLEGSRKIFQIAPDKDGNLWVLTDRHVFRRKNGSETFDKVSGQNGPFNCMAHDEEGIWIGGSDRIYRYSFATGSMDIFVDIPYEFECRSIDIINNNSLLCCSPEGKILVDSKNGSIAEAPFGDTKEVSATLVDYKGRIWLALYNKGIEVFSPDGTLLKNYTTDNSALSNNIVLCLAEKGSKILAGTDGGGINIIDPDTDAIQVHSHISGDSASLPASSIKSLHVDHYGDIWAGSIRKGLISVSQSDMHFYTDAHLGLTCGLSDPTVLCLHQDRSNGDIWIGTDGEGINRYNPSTSRFTHYRNTFKSKVASIADYSDTELAISVYGDNICIFNKATGTTRPIAISDNRFKYMIRHSGRSISLYNEEDGDLLILTNIVSRYDKKTGHCEHIEIEGMEESNSNFSVIGKNRNGIWLYNDCEIFLLKDDARELIFKGRHQHGNIRSGHLAENGIIWLATEEGLCSYDTTTGEFRPIKTTIFTDANSVICDKRSRVWVGTEKRLVAYLAESGTFAVFGESDGAVPTEYLPKSHLLASNGDIYLGGVQGLLHIRENYTIDASEKPVLKLNEVRIDDMELSLGESNVIKVERDDKSLSISISVQERDMFRHRAYRFSLANRTYETYSPTFTLKQMPKPGKYPVCVSCTKRNGKWTDPVHLMTMTVPLPWFLSWWFIGGVLILLALTYLTAIYSINKRKSNELKLAMQEQEQKVYEEKVNMLINVSHELRTPLTLIMAPLKRLLKGMNSESDGFSVLSRVYRQSRRMQSLLDMVLDLRKMEEGGSHLRIEPLEFNSWISGCVDDIVNEEKAEGINIIYDFDPSVGKAEIDRQKCDIVLMNILINAIKHSTQGDTITIRTTMTEGGLIRTSVSDQGPGLSADVDIERIFTRFYQSKSEKYGSGIGLSYSKILVEMHGGSIGVYNNPDMGATFWWEIPAVAISDGEVEGRAYLNELLGHSSEADNAVHDKEVFKTTGTTLMLVDDNQDLLDFLKDALSEEFGSIIALTGGNAAMHELASGRLPDIIVSDVNMPDGDGFWLCNEIKKNEKYSHIPFVLLTARGEAQSQSESYRLGADGFLAKPFEVETLMELIRSLLRNKAEIKKRYLDNETVSEADYGSNEEKFIIQLNRIISENLSNPDLDQQLICRELGVSRALLYNKMKSITGAGAKEYITRIRIEKAKALIETTHLTIAEISDMTGFASQSYFSTAFKNYEGMSPSQYKISKRNSAEQQ